MGEFEAASLPTQKIEAIFNLAVARFGMGQNEEAIAMLLDIITIDRSWNDDAARQIA